LIKRGMTTPKTMLAGGDGVNLSTGFLEAVVTLSPALPGKTTKTYQSHVTEPSRHAT
jgi:hypothetical protein